MSHFVLLAIVNPTDVMPAELGTGSTTTSSALTVEAIKAHKSSILAEVETMLVPFDENAEVEGYVTSCHCVGLRARMDARKQAKDETEERFNMTLDDLREQNRRKIEQMDPKPDPFSAETQAAWKETTFEYFAYHDKREAKALAAHPMHEKPDPKCEECKGEGTVVSTYNPNAKWDWYQFGGRWEGWLGDVKPEDDERNVETCYLCQGTGQRTDSVGNAARAENPEYTCNGCSGKGEKLKWPTDWADTDANIVLTDMAAAAKKIPFAFLTPEGEWIERGSMGWWGVVTDDKEQDDWDAQAQNVFAKYPQHIVVAVDCHI